MRRLNRTHNAGVSAVIQTEQKNTTAWFDTVNSPKVSETPLRRKQSPGRWSPIHINHLTLGHAKVHPPHKAKRAFTPNSKTRIYTEYHKPQHPKDSEAKRPAAHHVPPNHRSADVPGLPAQPGREGHRLYAVRTQMFQPVLPSDTHAADGGLRALCGGAPHTGPRTAGRRGHGRRPYGRPFARSPAARRRRR